MYVHLIGQTHSQPPADHRHWCLLLHRELPLVRDKGTIAGTLSVQLNDLCFELTDGRERQSVVVPRLVTHHRLIPERVGVGCGLTEGEREGEGGRERKRGKEGGREGGRGRGRERGRGKEAGRERGKEESNNIPYCDYLIRVLFNVNFAKTRKIALLNTRNNNVFTT